MQARGRFHRRVGQHLPLIMLTIWCVALVLEARPVAAQDESRFFPETGRTISGSFLRYWQANGGLSIFGYPISDVRNEIDPISGRILRVQWFERERFELHEEYAGTPSEVLLGLLGRQLTQDRQNEAAFQRITPFTGISDRSFFPQTGHSLRGSFKTFWESQGGLPVFGYPISEQLQERNASDGKLMTVQYFERARFESHPSNPTEYHILLGLLGHQLILPLSPSIQITAGASQMTIEPNQTALVPPGTTSIAVAMQFEKPVNQQTITVRLSQLPDLRQWQVVPSGRVPPPTGFLFGLRGKGSPPYFHVEVVRGSGNPAVYFGVQVGNHATVPALVAGWTDPVTLVHSFYNAINRQEFQRAYSYWENPGTPNGVTADFADFVQGYVNTRAVAVTTGTAVSGAGAGNIYFAVPVVLAASQTDGPTQQFYGCYLLHQSNVETGNTVPPYPIAVRAARIMAAPASSSPATLLNQASTLVQTGQCTQ